MFRPVAVRRVRGEDGGSAVEYGLLIAGIAALISAVVLLFGGFVNDLFESTCTSVETGSSGTQDC